MSQIRLFDVENRLAELSALGDPLEKLDTGVAAPVSQPSSAAVPGKKFCPSCGTEVQIGKKFCPQCGAKTD